jgi:uncharacterized protein YaaN involved in tellurite resistance
VSELERNTVTTTVPNSTTLTGELLAEPAIGSTDIVSLNNAAGRAPSKVSKERAAELARTINLKDSQSIISFGVESQRNVTTVSENMLTGVKAKDVGPIGDAMNSMVHEMRGLDFGSIKPGQKQGFISKLLGRASAVTLFVQKYENVSSKIVSAQNVLDGHRIQLLKDIVLLDKLYQATLEHLDSLDEQIAAVQYKLEEVNTVTIPEVQAKADASGDMGDAQAVRDITEARDSLERKLHDLELTRNITIQALPSIRIVQANDKGMAERIQSQIINTIPLWKQKTAVAIAAYRTEQAGKASKAATDYTNELIVESAKQLQTSNRVARTEIERGIFDVQAATEANELLIATINESIDIAEQGKQMRADAAKQLEAAETKLKQTLLAAAKRQSEMRAQ